MVLDLPFFFFFIVAVPSIEYPWHGHTHLHHYTMYCISRVLRVYWYVMIWFIIWMCVLCGRSSGNLLFSWLLPLASPTFSIENKSYRFLCSIPTHTHTPLKSTIFVIIIAAFHHLKKKIWLISSSYIISCLGISFFGCLFHRSLFTSSTIQYFMCATMWHYIHIYLSFLFDVSPLDRHCDILSKKKKNKQKREQFVSRSSTEARRMACSRPRLPDKTRSALYNK